MFPNVSVRILDHKSRDSAPTVKSGLLATFIKQQPACKGQYFVILNVCLIVHRPVLSKHLPSKVIYYVLWLAA